MTNPGENAAFANGYDTARSETRAAANNVIVQLAQVKKTLTVLAEQIEKLKHDTISIAFPAKPDGATDADDDRG
jgi:hypothetical protein